MRPLTRLPHLRSIHHSKPATTITTTPPRRPFSTSLSQPTHNYPTVTTSTSTPTSSALPTITQTINQPSLPFSYGSYLPSSIKPQLTPLSSIRLPRFTTLHAERAFRKLHHAVSLRWLGLNGYNNEGAGGHVTVRDPLLPDHFWINPHGKSFSLMRPEDLVLVDEDGVVKDGEGGNMHVVNPAGYVIHSAIHKARPDVVAVVHCHSVPSKAFSSLGCMLEPINQDACRFYEDHGLAPFGGIALEKHVEGEHIAHALGQTKACILQNHGHLTVAKTVDAATFLFGAFDRCMQAQLMADAAAAGRAARGDKEGNRTIKATEEVARYTRDAYNDERAYIMFQSAFEDVVRASNGELVMKVEGSCPGNDAMLVGRGVWWAEGIEPTLTVQPHECELLEKIHRCHKAP